MGVGAHTHDPGSGAMIRRRLRHAVMAIALACAIVSTAPAQAQVPSPDAAPGTVTAADPLPQSFWIAGAADVFALIGIRGDSDRRRGPS
ncbi:hypothetical protein BS618_33085 [Rhodococcus erythropolis]|nr:hypothetical protein BS618_33085 [Rhodococcus erythropolis]REK75407.1 hypothetical protein DVG80_33640 [Rhodococcus erythropolis]